MEIVWSSGTCREWSTNKRDFLNTTQQGKILLPVRCCSLFALDSGPLDLLKPQQHRALQICLATGSLSEFYCFLRFLRLPWGRSLPRGVGVRVPSRWHCCSVALGTATEAKQNVQTLLMLYMKLLYKAVYSSVQLLEAAQGLTCRIQCLYRSTPSTRAAPGTEAVFGCGQAPHTQRRARAWCLLAKGKEKYLDICLGEKLHSKFLKCRLSSAN